MDRFSDLAGQGLLVTVLVVAALPWLAGTPSDLMVWAFAVAPPVLLLGFLALRERRTMRTVSA